MGRFNQCHLTYQHIITGGGTATLEDPFANLAKLFNQREVAETRYKQDFRNELARQITWDTFNGMILAEIKTLAKKYAEPESEDVIIEPSDGGEAGDDTSMASEPEMEGGEYETGEDDS